MATKENEENDCVVVGNTLLPPSTVSSWYIKIIRSSTRTGKFIYIGVAPADINQNEDGNILKCGWYLHCKNTKLFSGPPYNYNNKRYGPYREDRS